jgi:hypothetical protein
MLWKKSPDVVVKFDVPTPSHNNNMQQKLIHQWLSVQISLIVDLHCKQTIQERRTKMQVQTLIKESNSAERISWNISRGKRQQMEGKERN